MSAPTPPPPGPEPPGPEPPDAEPPAPPTAPSPGPALEPPQVVRAAWIFYLLLGLGGVLWVGMREEVIPLALFVDPGGWWIDLALGVATGGALLAAWNLGIRRLAAARALEDRLREVIGALSSEEAILLAVLSGIAEELFFRGGVQGSWGWVWATLLFALLHSGPGSAFGLWTAFAAIAGGLFGGLMAWRGNLLAPVVAHVLVNAVNLRRLGAIHAREGAETEPAGSG